ncbi:MAG: hypothetical protein JJ992_05925, partial [Planctomycetes bacterium]|nr:hypothetical protein [Planctomycetota bacterium]
PEDVFYIRADEDTDPESLDAPEVAGFLVIQNGIAGWQRCVRSNHGLPGNVAGSWNIRPCLGSLTTQSCDDGTYGLTCLLTFLPPRLVLTLQVLLHLRFVREVIGYRP